MEYRSILDLVTIARAGGGLDFNAGFMSTVDLVQIARAAAMGKATLVLRGMAHRPITDLVAIARAGDGRVIYAS